MPGTRAIRLSTAIAVVLAALLRPPTASAATLQVVTTDDAGVGSLRQAILDANSAIGADEIQFAIPTSAVPRIIPATPLPSLTDPVTIDGTTQLPAGWVELDGEATAFASGLIVAGGDSTIRGLVINGFGQAGVVLSGLGGNVLEGNRIGCDVTGSQVRSPLAHGIEVSASSANRIGGTTAGAGNLISGNLFGIFIHGSTATDNVVEGNLIGTDATGAMAVPNAATGIWILGSGGTTIGGTDPAAGNVITGNATDGIDIGGAGGLDTTIAGNVVGLAADRVTPIGNGHDGIYVYGGAGSTSIGSVAGNRIGANGGAGVRLETTAAAGNTIRGNLIDGNDGLGIDLGPQGVTANDDGDLDGGANGQQNFPVLDEAFIGGTQIAGTLDGAASGTFVLEVFATAVCDASGYGEGGELLAAQAITTDEAGHGEFTATLSRAVDASIEHLTATVTDSSGNTSEFSPCTPATLLPTTSTTSTSLPPSSTTSTTSTTLVAEASTSTTLEASTTSTTLLPPSTTSTTVDPQTTTTTTPPPSTTSTTSLPPTTTTFTTLLPPSTTSTTVVPQTTTTTMLPPSTTSTTLPAPTTTTSTTLLPPSTTSTTVVPQTTTTTTLPSSTTSTTLPPPTTTTSTTLLPASTTSTTVVPQTTTTTALPSSTTSTSLLPPTSTSTTAVTQTSTTTTTAPAGSTTSTTLASCSGPDCPCLVEPSFASIDCRLAKLQATVAEMSDLRSDRGRLARLLERGVTLLGRAEGRCEAAKPGSSKHNLRGVERRIRRMLRVLRVGYLRRLPQPREVVELADVTIRVRDDTRALARSLDCR